MGDRTLFSNLSFGLHEKQKRALLGPNGAGKSTLLKILSQQETYEGGEVTYKKNLRMAYVAQEDQFPEKRSVLEIASERLESSGFDKSQSGVQAAIYLSMAGFTSLEESISKLSGGWRKRLSLAIALAQEPELLLLDEPTNHLDWEGILWLEDQLKVFGNSFLVVSHDREFLKNLCHEFMEINKLYKDGVFINQGTYEQFLEKKEGYLQGQLAQQASLSNKVRRETEWLRAGIKARTTKSQSRIKEAHQLIDDLSEMKSRTQSVSQQMKIRIDSAGKKSKKMIACDSLSISYGDKTILDNFECVWGPQQCIGLLGDNGSGKTSLLKVLAKKANNYQGSLFHAEDLKIVYFDQKRESLSREENLLDYLGDGSDHVQFLGRSLHVASYASQFLFDSHRMNLPIGRLSGGEQARLLIAKLLLQPADVLILDEPTNDLDIETLEILESSLSQFPGLCILVSHDRYFLKNLCHQFLALDGEGGWQVYAEVRQWLRNRKTKEEKKTSPKKSPSPKTRVKLSYQDKRKLENIEDEIAKAEGELAQAQKALESFTDFSDHAKMNELTKTMNDKQKSLDALFEFWQEMEEKQNPS
jgi:ATP-binding cassette subfamily F protein uup